MKPVEIDAFCNFKFLSNITWSPEGTTACLTVTNINKKKDQYQSYIYLLKDGKFKKITGTGKDSAFRYLDEDTLLFPRKDEDTEKHETTWYTLSLSGGEAQPAYTFPIPVSGLFPLPNGDMLAVGTTFPGFEELYKGEKRYLENYKKYNEENKDYEVISQAPWWWNGSTYTKGGYSSLFYYHAKKRRLERLSELNADISQVKLSEDKQSVYFLSTPVRPRLPLHGETSLCRMDLAERKITVLADDREDFALFTYALGDNFAILLAGDNRYGLNTDVDFYRLDYASGEVTLEARYGEAVGCTVGTDIRYGSGQALKMEGDRLYFISTRFDDAKLYQLENGVITAVTDRDGSVDSFDVKNGKILMIGLHDMRCQEVYDGNGKRLSHFNDSALRGRYVAEPEVLNVERDGYEIHGFVLKPMNYDPAKRYPVILDIHGGPKTVYGPIFYHEMQYWAGKGYFVIFCNPTGSDGRGDFMDIRGKYGTVDYDDLMAFTDAALEAYPAMDPDNLFETGGSYGGFMTNWIIGHTDRFRACASQRSISNWFSFYGVADIGLDFATDQCSADPWSDPEKLWWHSPMKYANQVKTPTLFIHSMEDYRCPIDQGYQMFASLLDHGVETRMVCFRGENHELSRSGKPSHRIRRLKEITEWFEKHRKRQASNAAAK